MKYKEFKEALATKVAEANATPRLMAMSAPSEARQRIDAYIADFRAKKEAAKNQ